LLIGIKRLATSYVTQFGIGMHDELVAGQSHKNIRSSQCRRDPGDGRHIRNLSRCQEFGQSLNMVEKAGSGVYFKYQNSWPVFLDGLMLKFHRDRRNPIENVVLNRAGHCDKLAKRYFLSRRILIIRTERFRREELQCDQRDWNKDTNKINFHKIAPS